MSKYHFVKKKYLHERIYKDARKHVRDFLHLWSIWVINILVVLWKFYK